MKTSYRIDIDNLLPMQLYMYVQRWYRRYQQCCHDIVSILTIDFPYSCTCTYDVDIVDFDNVVTMSCRYRQLTSYTLLCVRTVSISSISTMLWRYRIDIDNWLPIHFYMYVRCRYRRYRQYFDDILSISTIEFSFLFMYLQLMLQTSNIFLTNRRESTRGYLALNYKFNQS
jgi:hypothetical protein